MITQESVNLAEFFIAVTVSAIFLTQLDLARYGKPVIGLIVGGAPSVLNLARLFA